MAPSAEDWVNDKCDLMIFHRYANINLIAQDQKRNLIHVYKAMIFNDWTRGSNMSHVNKFVIFPYVCHNRVRKSESRNLLQKKALGTL